MNVNSTRKDSANAVVVAEISSQTIENTENKIASSLSKTAKIDGFRKGKVPLNVIKKTYQEQILTQRNQELFSQVLSKSIEDLKITQNDVIGDAVFNKFENNDNKIDMEFKISIRPEVKLGDYKSMIPEIKVPKVDNKKIEENLKNYYSNFAEISDAEDSAKLANGDIAVMDFAGYLGDEQFEGGSAQNHSLDIGSNTFIPGFEEQMVGMKKGESKDINVTFPTEYGAEKLAGKDVIFKVTLNNIQTKKLPETLNEEQLKTLLPNVENPTIEKLKQDIEQSLQNQELNGVFADEVRPEFIENLVKNHKFDLPEAIIEKEIDNLLNRSLQSKSEDEIKKLSNDKEAVEKLRTEFVEEAENNVKMTFLIDELSKKESIEVNDQEVSQVIYMEAYQSGKNPADHFKLYQERGLIPVVKMSLIENKLLEKIFREKAGLK
ncbi:MAG: Cell division trigger factor (EC [uncultured Campylobacterales bacterium]|uniref:Trigger factor n=1 Tax=uncultured Campylobacterales bacterium TaxID=352960 RepID=A0A6S6T754_9BACT|nr:MAG: Cell division trigger factor (EC [uncultured Campylobacterales bacterium]